MEKTVLEKRNGEAVPLADTGGCWHLLLQYYSVVFFGGTLDVPVWGAEGFAPYSVLPFVCPAAALLLAVFGVGISRISPEEQAEELAEIEEEENEAFVA